MIQVERITKRFGRKDALRDVSCSIPDGCVYGMVGSNGAGKSTLLRLVSGVYRPDGGSIRIDGNPVLGSPEARAKVAFVPDELFFLPQANLNRMAAFYAACYPRFSRERYRHLAETFRLDPKAPLHTFSKGMRRQAASILALSCRAKHLLLDETFDGLDPVMRNLLRRTLYEDVEALGASCVLTSHSLRELEDTCDQLALLHQGGVVFERDVQNLNTTLFKVQVAYPAPYDRTKFEGLCLLSCRQKGSVSNLIVRGDREEVLSRLRAMQPLLLELLPLTLEEVFLYEMETLGYVFPESMEESDENKMV